MKTRKTKKQGAEIAATREREVARAVRDLEISIGMSFQLFKKRVANIFEPGSAADLAAVAPLAPSDPLGTEIDPRYFESVIADEPHAKKRKTTKKNGQSEGVLQGHLATSLPTDAGKHTVAPRIAMKPMRIDGDIALSPAARRVLEVLVAWDKPASTTLLSIFTAYSLMSGGFAAALAELKQKNLVYTPSPAVLSLSEAGSLAVGHVPALPRGRALLEQTMARFDPCSAAIAWFLYTNHPETHTAKNVAESTRSPKGQPYSATSGGFAASLAKLRKQGIITDEHGAPIGLSREFVLAAGEVR